MQRQRGQHCATPWTPQSRWWAAGAGARTRILSTRAGEKDGHERVNGWGSGGFASLPAGRAAGEYGRGAGLHALGAPAQVFRGGAPSAAWQGRSRGKAHRAGTRRCASRGCAGPLGTAQPRHGGQGMTWPQRKQVQDQRIAAGRGLRHTPGGEDWRVRSGMTARRRGHCRHMPHARASPARDDWWGGSACPPASRALKASSSALASWRSAVSKPSVNQP